MKQKFSFLFDLLPLHSAINKLHPDDFNSSIISLTTF